ncbi:class II glutamine amidotransferase [Kitasatospora paranensis]|uniref:class II glutamine amidotransferase n=1 Tax=Kitasatospora paranensis TaxID=258053 RepID=UPI0036103524
MALTFGLQDDTPLAVERMIGTIEAAGNRHGVPDPLQMTVAVSDGRRLWAFRYSTERHSRTLFFSTDVRTLRALHPEIEALREVADGARIVVSEPLGDLTGAWHEVPESSYGHVADGGGELRGLVPRPA